MLDAALDAAALRAWPRQSPRYRDGGVAEYWSNQGRLCAAAMELVGVTGRSSELADTIACVLGVPRMLLDEQARAIDEAPGYHSRGRAICAVLQSIPPGKQLLARLLESGCVAGLWGVPWHWDPLTRSLRRMPFRLSGTRAPPPPALRPGAATKAER